MVKGKIKMYPSSYKILVLTINGWKRHESDLWSKIGKTHKLQFSDGRYVETTLWSLDEAWEDLQIQRK